MCNSRSEPRGGLYHSEHMKKETQHAKAYLIASFFNFINNIIYFGLTLCFHLTYPILHNDIDSHRTVPNGPVAILTRLQVRFYPSNLT